MSPLLNKVNLFLNYLFICLFIYLFVVNPAKIQETREVKDSIYLQYGGEGLSMYLMGNLFRRARGQGGEDTVGSWDLLYNVNNSIRDGRPNERQLHFL